MVPESPLPPPEEENQLLPLHKDIQGTIYTFFRIEYPSIPQTEVDQIVEELEKYNISHRVFRYDGSEHGFFCNLRSSYNTKAAPYAWEQVQ
jgi:carboxymethylenebutenolidase